MSERNFAEYRDSVLEKLGAEGTNVRNTREYRAAVLDALGAEYEDEDTVNFERWRVKVLDNLGSGGGGGSSDLEYETGLFEPNEDIYGCWINFANTHATPPMYISFADTDISTIDVNTPNSAVSWSYVYLSNWVDYPDGFNRVGVTQSVYTLNDAISGTQAGMGDPTTNFATNEKFSPYGVNATKVFRAGRSYKWIAIWTPTL